MAEAKPRAFLVTSPGYTATKWVSWALNLHPEIYCNHFTEGSASDVDYSPREWQELFGRHKRYDSFKGALDFFDRLRRQAMAEGKSFGGNAGAFSAIWLHEKYMRKTPENPPKTVNLLRFPPDWIMSGAHLMAQAAEMMPRRRKELDEVLDGDLSIFKKLGVPEKLSLVDKAFVYMCYRMYHLVGEASLPWISHFRMEDVTSDRRAFAEMVGDLTGLDVSGDKRYLNRVFGRGSFHRHNPKKIRFPQNQYETWKPWQRRVYEYDVRESGIAEPYTEFGYDMTLKHTRAAKTRKKLKT